MVRPFKTVCGCAAGARVRGRITLKTRFGSGSIGRWAGQLVGNQATRETNCWVAIVRRFRKSLSAAEAHAADRENLHNLYVLTERGGILAMTV